MAPDAARSLAAALGEAVERYSASDVPPERLVRGSAASLAPLAVEPFALYAEEQLATPGFPLARFAEETELHWVDGVELREGAPALLPAQLVYLGAVPFAEPRIGIATSNGLACRATLDEAVLVGLLELVERDAFVIAWRNRLTLPRLQLDACDTRRYDRTGFRYSAIDLSAFWDVPTALGVVRSDAPAHAALGVGAGAGATGREAALKALEEAFQVIAFAQHLQESNPGRDFGGDLSGVRDFDDHVALYADHARAARTSFLDTSTETRPVGAVPPLEGDDVRARIDALTKRLAARGIRAYAVDVTSPDVCAAGLRVVRVLAPGLCPLDAVHGLRELGSRRLYEAAWELGLLPGRLTVDDLNPDPHPFP
jgi:ribosomal protein S12 methylthiotransferase accessory factor